MEWCDQIWIFLTHISVVCLVIKRQSLWADGHYLHGQTWRWTCFVMGVFYCYMKWKYLPYDGLDDQWTFLQDIHPKVYIHTYWSLVQGSVMECSWKACSAFKCKSHWKYLVELKENNDNIKKKIMFVVKDGKCRTPSVVFSEECNESHDPSPSG